jgi:hypothetical protein
VLCCDVVRGEKGYRALSDVSRVGRHSDELCYVAWDMGAVCVALVRVTTD